MTFVEWLVGVAGLGLGLFSGYITCYVTQVRPLTEQVIKMRKMGFVPHFDVTEENQVREPDPSRDIRER